jgi:hypothetical protein
MPKFVSTEDQYDQHREREEIPCVERSSDVLKPSNNRIRNADTAQKVANARHEHTDDCTGD